MQSLYNASRLKLMIFYFTLQRYVSFSGSDPFDLWCLLYSLFVAFAQLHLPSGCVDQCL